MTSTIRERNAARIEPLPSPTRPKTVHTPRACITPVVEATDSPLRNVTSKYDEAAQRKKDLAQQLLQEKRAEVADEVRRTIALASGEKPAPPPKEWPAQKVQDELDKVERELLVLSEAGRETAELLHAAIKAEKEPWLKAIAKKEAEVASRYRDAISEARAAANELRELRGAAGWLDLVTDNAIPRGVSTGRFLCRLPHGPEIPVADLLSALGNAAEEPRA